MTLTHKQKSALKALGQNLPDDAQLGKGGLSDAFLSHARLLLTRKELIKVRLADTDLHGEARKAMAAEACAALDAECVAVVGRTVLAYRANPGLPAEERALKE